MSDVSKIRIRYKIVESGKGALVVSAINNKVVLVSESMESAQAYVNAIINFPFKRANQD